MQGGVALQIHGAANAFLSGPLELREGVALVVDKGVILYESVDPEVLQMSPGSCGMVSNAPGRGCKPLISVENVAGAAVMGDGVIDGHGVKLLGKKDSAWDLAEQARPGGGQNVSRIFAACDQVLKQTPDRFANFANRGLSFMGCRFPRPRFPQRILAG
jgi:polygalacturonase